MENVEKWASMLYEMLISYGPKLIYGIIVLFLGLWITKIMTRSISKLMAKRNIDASLRPFVRSSVSIVLKALVIITVAGMLGVEMTSFVAMLGAAGFAIGMALSGTLQNFAGGVMILIFKPFKVGDYIEAQSYFGLVVEIQIFNTILNTPDNKVIIIPNGGLSTGSMVNYSKNPTRRLDFTFGIGYSDDIDKAKAVLYDIVNAYDNILKDPAAFIAVSELGDSSVNFIVRVWVKSENYWAVHFYLPEQVKKGFDNNGISIPFPQRDVHLHQ
jgi:small conductance mechanosensitive channel